MTRGLKLCLVGCGLASAASAAAAEPPSPLVPGTRLRIEAPTVLAHRFDGTLVGIEDATFTVDVGKGALVRVPRVAVSRLDVSVGRRRQTLRGMAWGTAIGAALFALVPPAGDHCDVPPCWTTRGGGAAWGAFFGASYGSLIGTFIKRDRWSPVTLAAASAGNRGRRFGVGLSFSF